MPDFLCRQSVLNDTKYSPGYGSVALVYVRNRNNKLPRKRHHDFRTMQNIAGKWGLGGVRCTAVEAIRGHMGWSTFRERKIKGKLGSVKKIVEKWM